MAVKIRLKRLGKIRAPYYRIVVADSRTKRDGRVIEEIGKYHPTEHPSLIEVNSDRAQYWLGVGAQPTEQVAALLKLTGDWAKFKGEKEIESRVLLPEAKAAFAVDEKKKPVLRPKAEVPVKAAPAAAEAEAVADFEEEGNPAVEAAAEIEAVEAPAAAGPVAEAAAVADFEEEGNPPVEAEAEAAIEATETDAEAVDAADAE